jgi:hypothetical protein
MRAGAKRRDRVVSRQTVRAAARAIAACALLASSLTSALHATAVAGEDRSGATETHWSFRPIRMPAVPAPRNTAWVRNPIDAFVLCKLEAEGVEPAAPASRLILLRRAHFDLLGLPPSPEEIEAFLADRTPDAYERLVERLLASPHYGERWARHWLDVVRYGDTGGFEADLRFAQSWRYRDYVIRSLAADKPLDRLIQEQVAGDEIWPDDPDAVLGTALYGVGPALADSAMVSGQLEYDWLTDAADTTGEVFLGLTLGCARCHNHKYDPISQRDYFAMQAIFAASDRPYPGKVRLNRVKALNGLLSDAPVPDALMNDPRCTVMVDDRNDLRLYHRREPLEVHRLHRGELNKPQEVMEPAVPLALQRVDCPGDFSTAAATERRAVLARWLTGRENPLVRRVLVNRVWGWHFGQAIVRTPNNFGTQGDEPTHPELLDYLACALWDHGWSLKDLHRLIMLSNIYRMSSKPAGAAAEDDPENLWLAHFPRRRLEGEEIRDAMLACSGGLSLRPFGKPVVPPLERDELTGLFDAKEKWPVTKEPAEHTRRSVYLLVRRTFTYPLFSAFDPPALMASCERRMQTIVPTQALTLLNSPLAREQSVALASRLVGDQREHSGSAIGSAWLLTFGRPVTDEESAHAREFLKTRETAGVNALAALAELCLALFNANEFIFID